MCRCGDPRNAHAHYRRGDDCACGCRKFRRRWFLKRPGQTLTPLPNA
jgi:hypothetical protein